MSDTERSLLDAVLENPDDDLPRLVYADFLEEHGDAKRAEFIRAQIVLALLVRKEAFDSNEYASATKSIMSFSLADYQTIFERMNILLSPKELYFSNDHGDKALIRDHSINAQFCMHRGFLEEIFAEFNWINQNWPNLTSQPFSLITTDIEIEDIDLRAEIDLKIVDRRAEQPWQIKVGYNNIYTRVVRDCRFHKWADIAISGGIFIQNTLANPILTHPN